MENGERPGEARTCCKCGESFIRLSAESWQSLKDGKPGMIIQRGEFYYCGYCDSVIYGEPNKAWLPSLKKSDKLPGGFHTI